MKTKVMVATVLLAMTGAGFAGEAQFSPGEIIHPAPSIESVSAFSGVQLGKSHVRLDGLLLDGAIPRDTRKDRSIADKVLGLPVVNLMVRKSPPVPADNGGYFKWKESSRQPWVAVAARAGDRGSFSTISGDGPTPGLISLNF